MLLEVCPPLPIITNRPKKSLESDQTFLSCGWGLGTRLGESGRVWVGCGNETRREWEGVGGVWERD